jgi:hypothetical protein
MATLQAIRTAVDAKLTALWPTIQAKQDTYAANHNGRYWQGILTHTVTPSDGVESLPDIGTRCPTDQLGDPWPAGIRDVTLPMALVMDVYDGPLGVGYVATVYVRVLGNLYSRSQNVGPEAYRTVNWAQVT